MGGEQGRDSSSRVLLLIDDPNTEIRISQTPSTNSDAQGHVLSCCARLIVFILVVAGISLWIFHWTTIGLATHYITQHRHHFNQPNRTELFVGGGHDIIKISWEALAIVRIVLGAVHLLMSMIYWAFVWGLPQDLTHSMAVRNCKKVVVILNVVTYVGVTGLCIFLLIILGPNFSNLNDSTNVAALSFLFLTAWETIGIIILGLHNSLRKDPLLDIPLPQDDTPIDFLI